MQSRTSKEMELDIGGHVVHMGSKANVQWRGVWYDGTVIKIGPKRKLCRVRDVVTDKTFLTEPNQLKFMETHALKKNFSQGTHVAYNDGDKWMEGVVEKENAVGAALVRWRKNVLAAENDSWFELRDIAPVIANEAYFAKDGNELKASRSGLFQNNMIEPHPRTVQNMLYESDADSEDTRPGSPYHLEQLQHYPHHAQETNHFTIHTSPTYESITSPEPLDSQAKLSPQHRPLPIPPHSPYAGTMQPPMVFPHIVPYRYDWGKENHFHSSRHPKPPMKKNLQSTSVPVAWTYKFHYKNGIPPHQSSNFFKHFRKYGSQGKRSTSASQANLSMTPSPSIISKAHSEPMPFTFQSVGSNVIPPRNIRKASDKRPLFRDGKWGWKKNPTKRKEEKPLAPSPYEVPVETAPSLLVEENPEQDVFILSDTPEKRSASHGDLSRNKKGTDSPSKQDYALPTVASASPSKLHVNTGGHLLLTCVAKSIKPVTYEWSKDGNTISTKDDNFTIPSPGMLEMKKATLEDAGEYTCTVSSENGSITKTFEIFVMEDFFSVFSGSPSKQDTGLQTKFTSRVTTDEITLRPSDPPADRTVQDFLNEIVEDISADLDYDTIDFHTDETHKPVEKKYNSDLENEETDKVPDLPSIVVTSEHVPEKQVRRRHSVMRNDMEQYLEGYGENYGALSSSTDLELEGLKHYKAKEIAKKTKEREENKKDKTSSPKLKSKRFLRFPKFHKSSKKVSDDCEPVPTKEITTDRAAHSLENPTETSPDNIDENSVAVNTSLGSTESVPGMEEDEGHVKLPLEVESKSDQVRRLQLSLQEHDESQLPQGNKKKGVFASIFSSKGK